MSTSQTPATALGDLIRVDNFEVPSHQRDYSWSKAHIQRFLKDVETAMKKDSDQYFCGLMVFTEISPRLLKVLDGQQRLATTIILFSAIRNWLHGYSDFAKTEGQFEQTYLQSEPIGAAEPKPKMSLTAANNEVFRRLVYNVAKPLDIKNAVKETSPEDRSYILIKAVEQIDKHVRELATGFASEDLAKEHLIALASFISTKVNVVRYVVPNDRVAYTIFETLNDRGLALKPLDLVKNHIFSRAGEVENGGLERAEKRWGEMMELLGSDRADTFLLAFHNSRFPKKQGSYIFQSLKDRFSTPEQIVDLSNSLHKFSEYFNSLYDHRDHFWSRYDQSVRGHVEGLSVIRPTQLYPLILSAIERFEKAEIVKLVKLIEVLAFRHQLIGGGRTARMESLSAPIARKIWAGTITKAAQVKSELVELYVSDSATENNFKEATEKDSKKARYVLARIERQALLRSKEVLDKELDISENVTLEHIYPKRPGDKWIDSLEKYESEKQIAFRYGNLCLLASANGIVGNENWSTKKKIFEKSRIRTTNKILQYEEDGDWTPSSISERGAHLAKLAVSQWRY